MKKVRNTMKTFRRKIGRRTRKVFLLKQFSVNSKRAPCKRQRKDLNMIILNLWNEENFEWTESLQWIFGQEIWGTEFYFNSRFGFNWTVAPQTIGEDLGQNRIYAEELKIQKIGGANCDDGHLDLFGFWQVVSKVNFMNFERWIKWRRIRWRMWNLN